MTHPRTVSSPEHAGPRVVGCAGSTLRRQFRADPASVPYVYRIGSKVLVSTPKMHAELHGTDIAWTDCQGCWALGAEDE